MINIMIIEDDPMIRLINEEFIKKIEGFSIVASISDIIEGENYLNNNKVDLILLDVFLPSGNGIDFLKNLRKNDIKTDAILITAENKIDSINEAFLYGAVDYIVKPYRFERLKESLNKYKSRFEKINTEKTVDQSIIDKYIVKPQFKSTNEDSSTVDYSSHSNKRASEGKILTKGLNINTYNQVMNFINNNIERKLTSETVAEEVGLARVTVRRYLDYMVKEGSLELIQEYGKIGRPTHYYKKILK